MKITLVMVSMVLTAATVFAEELSSCTDEEIGHIYGNQGLILPRLIGNFDYIGVGRFIGDCSTTNVSFADISVQQWWTPDPGTNTVRIRKIDRLFEEWIFPTNVPVVFFIAIKADWYGTNATFYITNAAERAQLTFINADRSWFRTTRDNGLVYDFATNLWECMRANPNPTNYYTVLRDTERTVSEQDSWRVRLDAYEGLSWLFHDASESYLAEKLNDPLLSPIMRNSVGNRLWDRFGWTYTVTNNTVQWHPPQ